MKHRTIGLLQAADALGLELPVFAVNHPQEISRAFVALSVARPDALLVLHTAMFGTARRQIAERAARQQPPAITADMEFPQVGGLLAYGINRPGIYRRAASYVDRIFKGAQPGDLPVERPMKFDFIINLKTAKALGLMIPPSIFLQAAQMIQ